MPAEAERALEAKRLIAERCLYGLDINPLAVELAKLALVDYLSKDARLVF